jgi:hypothetical protein
MKGVAVIQRDDLRPWAQGAALRPHPQWSSQ